MKKKWQFYPYDHSVSHCLWPSSVVQPAKVPAGAVSWARLSFTMYDQGWGNMKGRVFATSSIPSTDPGAKSGRASSAFWASATAPHDSKDGKVTQDFGADSALVKHLNDPAFIWSEARTIELGRYIGGGGGHVLHIRNLTLTARVQTLDAAAAAFSSCNPLRVKFLSGDVVTIPAGWASTNKHRSARRATLLELLCAEWDPEKPNPPQPEEVELVGPDGTALDPDMTGLGYVQTLLTRLGSAALIPGQAGLAATFRPTVTVVAELSSPPSVKVADGTERRQDILVVVSRTSTVRYLRRKLHAAFGQPAHPPLSFRCYPGAAAAAAAATDASGARPKQYRSADDRTLLKSVGIAAGSVLEVKVSSRSGGDCTCS